MCTNQGFKSFVLTDEINNHFLYYYLKHIKPVAEQMATGTTFKELSGSATAKLPIVIAPFAEQKRIADKLDTLLASVDATRERLDRIPNILKQFRQSVLAAATSGRLTEGWRDSGNMRLAEIESELASDRLKKWNGRGKYKPAIKCEEVDSEEFAEIPEGWYRGTVDEITWSVKDGPHFSPKYELTGVPFISGGSIKPGKIDISNCKYISKDLHAELSLRCKPELLDVLYTKGGTTGFAAVNTIEMDFNVWVHVAVLKLLDKNLVDPFYIEMALNSPECYAQSQRYTHGVGNQDLGLTRMIKIVIPVPRVDEQKEIVRRVKALFALADKLEARYQQARAQVEKLTPALLAKAFRGELVVQDPNDEPAEMLLERIRAERHSTIKPARHKVAAATSAAKASALNKRGRPRKV
jgi:type I restriction enzyme S subunit